MSYGGPPPRYTNPAELASGYSPGAGHASGLSRSFDEGELHQHSPQHPHQGEPGAVTPGAAAAAAQGLFGSTPQREAEQRSPQPRGSPWVPPGMDPASYAAGERAAALAAFQRLLPSHQALGQLMAALEALSVRLDEEVAQWRGLQLQHAKTATQVETAVQRLDTLEFLRIPQLQEKCDEAAAQLGTSGPGVSAEVADALHSLQQVLATLSQQQAQQLQQGGASGGAAGHLLRLLHTAAAYAQRALSKADVAALLLSRKILLTEVAAGEGMGGRGRGWQAAQRGTGAALFVVAVEALYSAQRRLEARQLQPRALHSVLRSAGLAVRVARVAVWSAAAVLAFSGLKGACSAAAEAGCTALSTMAASQPRWLLSRMPWHKPSGAKPAGSKQAEGSGSAAS